MPNPHFASPSLSNLTRSSPPIHDKRQHKHIASIDLRAGRAPMPVWPQVTITARNVLVTGKSLSQFNLQP